MTYQQLCERKLPALQQQAAVRVLAIESSCDETASAVVENGRRVLGAAVFSQIDLHALYGGVVPEIAGRAHVDAVDRVVDLALSEAGMTLSDIDALAVTCGPGLVGALLIGVSCAKGLALALGKPLVAVNHIEGHVSANFIASPELSPPFLCLVASGGHSHILEVADYGAYRLLGRTQDDAAGEAFDKAARVLKLPYPGGPLLDKLAKTGDPDRYKLPRSKIEGKYDLSFSGLKTAFINLEHTLSARGERYRPEDMAACFQKAVVSALCDKTLLAARDTGARKLALAGGVSANSFLRAEMERLCAREGITLYMPPLSLCGDNAAMIGSAAYFRLMRGELAALSLNAQPALQLV